MFDAVWTYCFYSGKMIRVIYLSLMSLSFINELTRGVIIKEFGRQNISSFTAYSMKATMTSRSDVQCAYWCSIRSCLAVTFNHTSKECIMYQNKTNITSETENGVSGDIWFHLNTKVKEDAEDSMTITSALQTYTASDDDLVVGTTTEQSIITSKGDPVVVTSTEQTNSAPADDIVVFTSTQQFSTTLELMDAAFGKTTQTSDTNADSATAVDGDPNTISSIYGTNPYWSVDIETIYVVKRVEILAPNQYAEDLHHLDILIGTTTNTYELCAQFVGPATNAQQLTFTCNQDGRFVKITKQGQTGFLELAEVKVYVPA